jgi:hypothetical protein
LKAEKESSLQLSINADVEKNNAMVDPDKFSNNSPEKTVAEFLVCWKNKDWKGMQNYTQQSWNAKQENLEEEFEDIFIENLTGAEIISVTNIASARFDIRVKLYYTLGSNVDVSIITPIVVLENGKWGVNPTSTLKKEKELR